MEHLQVLLQICILCKSIWFSSMSEIYTDGLGCSSVAEHLLSMRTHAQSPASPKTNKGEQNQEIKTYTEIFSGKNKTKQKNVLKKANLLKHLIGKNNLKAIIHVWYLK